MHAFLADRVLNRPLLLHPDKAAIIMDVIAGRIGLDMAPVDHLSPEASRFAGRRMGDRVNPIEDGVAVITIEGSLVNRGAWIGARSGLVSYEGIAAQVAEAASDPAVHSVVLDIDSGGGEAGGVKALSDRIAALARKKRVVAVVNDTAASAAYWIASAASEIVVSETSMVGSLGVVVLHVDRSAELAKKGWSPTLIHAGAHKVDGNSLGPLADQARAELQTVVDDLYGLFCRSVAANRGGRLTAAAARATEARVFYGQASVAAGLADRVGTFDGVLRSLRKASTGARPSRGSGVAAEVQGPSAASTAPVAAAPQHFSFRVLDDSSSKKSPAAEAAPVWRRSIDRINSNRSP